MQSARAQSTPVTTTPSRMLELTTLPPSLRLSLTLSNPTMPLPHSLLQPPLFPPPFLASLFPPTGPLAWLLRSLRLCYSFTIALPLLFLSALLPFHLLPTLPSRDTATSTVVPLISQFIWSATWGFLDPGDAPASGEARRRGEGEEDGPKLTLWLYGRKEGVKAKGVVVDPAAEKWCRGVVKDGFGGAKTVRRGRVGGSWVQRTKTAEGGGKEAGFKGDDKAGEEERVVMYVVGGGYVNGDPLLGPFIFNLLRSSPLGTRFFAPSYRMAQHPSTSFPAALQDLLASWIYLVKEKGFKPRNITLAGDSAGAGAIWSLVAYLGVLSEEKEGAGLGVPGKVAMFSPWADLTLTHPTYISNAPFDILNRAQCVTAASFYLRNLDSPGPSPPSSARGSTKEITTGAQLLEREAFDRLGAAHPLFSPSALAHHQHVHAQGEEKELKDASRGLKESAATVHDDTTSGQDVSGASSPSGYHSMTSGVSSPTSSSASSSNTDLNNPLSPFTSSQTQTTPSLRPTSPLLSLFLNPILASETRFLLHSGSAELFASEIALFTASLQAAGIPVWSLVEDGMCHGAAQSFSMAETKEGGRWTGGGKSARKAGRTFGSWLEGGGGREGGGEGWVWGD